MAEDEYKAENGICEKRLQRLKRPGLFGIRNEPKRPEAGDETKSQEPLSATSKKPLSPHIEKTPEPNVKPKKRDWRCNGYAPREKTILKKSKNLMKSPVLKPTGKPVKDTTWQVDAAYWMRKLFKEARYKGAYGGRAGSKSHGFATLMLIEHVRDQNRTSICVREVQKSLNQSVKKLLEDKIHFFKLEDYFDIKSTEIRSRRGYGKILFQGMQDHTADTIKSFEGADCAWVEEAQVLSQKSLDLLRPTIRKPGSEIWFSWNPSLATDPVDAFLRAKEPPPDSIVVEVNYEDNPWLNDTIIREIEYDQRANKSKYNHIWRGKYKTHADALVFNNWRIEEFDAPPGTIFRFGADWGFGGEDATVLVRTFIEGRTLYVDYEAWQLKCRIDDTPALFLTVPGAETWTITADSNRPDRIAHLSDRGFKVYPAIKGAGSVEAGVEWLQNYEIVVHPRCVKTIDELGLYSHRVDPLTGKVLSALDDKNNHVIDALRYANEGVRRLAKKPPVVVNMHIVSRWNNSSDRVGRVA